MFRNSGKHLSLHLVNFYSSQLSGCKHHELLWAKGAGKGPVFLRARSPLELFRCLPRFFLRCGWLGLCFAGGCARAGRPGAAVRRPCRPALPCPAQSLPLAAATSALLYPVTLSLSLCSSLSVMDTFPSQSHMLGARRSEQINYFQLQARAGGGGQEGGGAPPRPGPAGRGAASHSPGNMQGDDSRASQILFKCKRM